MIKVAELKGLKSLRAFNAFHSLVLGVKMLPAYLSESYEDFLARVESLAPADQEKIIRQGAMFVELEPDEVLALVSFCTDKNGIPYDRTNVGNLNPAELIEIMVAVCVELAKIKVDMVTASEKKSLEPTA